jgi:hypothetical protein
VAVRGYSKAPRGGSIEEPTEQIEGAVFLEAVPVCLWDYGLMRWFVLWLFSDFFFRRDNLAEAIIGIRVETFIASRHSFVAGCQ